MTGPNKWTRIKRQKGTNDATTMLSKKLLAWASAQDKRLNRAYPMKSEREALLAYTVKLMEESGELADAVLATHSLQRRDKSRKAEMDALALECADVIITTLTIARRAGVDINAALKRKIVKINTRFGKFDRKK